MADTKITGLTANTTPVSTDVTVIIDDPGGTAASQKITLANLMALFANPVSDDGDSLGLTGTKWSDLFLASGAVIDFGSANLVLTHAAGTLTMSAGSLVLPAGTTALAPLVITPSANLLTTPVDGALEMNGDTFYGTVDGGNRGIIPIIHYIRAPSDQTLTSSTAAQQIFDSPANGQITLETGSYEFEALVQISGMSATSGNGQILFAGTGTFTDWNWKISGLDGTALTTIADDDSAYFLTNASAASAVAAQTNTVMRFELKGFVECSSGGTLIPQIDLVTAAAATVESGSCFKIWRIGAQATASVGQWD